MNKSCFQKIAEYKGGMFNIFLPKQKYNSNNYGVYMIIFPDNQAYIGVSENLYKRIRQHYWGMLNSHCSLPQLLEAFKKNREYTVYLLTEKRGVNEPDEESFIWAFRPSLNRYRPSSSRIRIKTLQGIANVIGCTVGDFFADELDGVICCPHCGKRFKVVPVD